MIDYIFLIIQMAEEVLEEKREECANSSQPISNPNSSKCSSEQLRPVNNVAGKLDLSSNAPARKGAGMLPLLHMTMYQPNLYFWKQRSVKNLQVSIFFNKMVIIFIIIYGPITFLKLHIPQLSNHLLNNTT